MTIRANHLTLGRIILLPIPLAMLYRGGAGWTAAGLLTLIGLGLTDVFDGPLARRQEPTRLGPVLEGIADRVFVVVLYSFLVDLGIVSTAALALLAGRELFVAALRGIAIKTAVIGRAGRLKMTVQMMGAGFLLLMWFLPGGPWIHAILGVAVAVSAALLIASWRRCRRPDWRAAWATGLAIALAVARALLPLHVAIDLLVAIILGITLVSGLTFAWSVSEEAFARLAIGPVDLVRLILATLVVPVIWIPLVEIGPLMTAAVAGVCAAELTLLGLGAALAGTGAPPGPMSALARSLWVAAAGVLTRVLAIQSDEGIAVTLLTVATLVMLAVETLRQSLRTVHRLAVAGPLNQHGLKESRLGP